MRLVQRHRIGAGAVSYDAGSDDAGSDDSTDLGRWQTQRTTEKAISVIHSDGKTEMWVPLSVIHDDSEVWTNNQTGKLVVKRWWAEKQGLA